jgi:mono/diheme cytochrome c family protein
MRFTMTVFAIGLAALVLSAQEPKPKLEVAPVRNRGLTKGPELYQAYCAPCHGKDGKGDGPAAAALKTTPTDLTTLAKTHGGKFPVGGVREVLGGGSSTPAHGSAEMPVWGPIFRSMHSNQSIAALQVDNLVHYLESIQSK